MIFKASELDDYNNERNRYGLNVCFPSSSVEILNPNMLVSGGGRGWGGN